MGRDAYVGGEAVVCCVHVGEGGGEDDTWVRWGHVGLRLFFVSVV